MLNIAIFVSGGGTNLQSIIDAIDNKIITNAKISIVVSSKNNAFALERAKKHNIKSVVICKKHFKSHDEYELEVCKALKHYSVDLIVLAGFVTILSKKFIRAYPEKIINVHPSLIPSFCGENFYGLKVHDEAIKRGVKITGATVHYVSEIIDGGKIICQKAVEVYDDDTPEILQKRVMEQAEWIILPKAINYISSKHCSKKPLDLV